MERKIWPKTSNTENRISAQYMSGQRIFIEGAELYSENPNVKL